MLPKCIYILLITLMTIRAGANGNLNCVNHFQTAAIFTSYLGFAAQQGFIDRAVLTSQQLIDRTESIANIHLINPSSPPQGDLIPVDIVRSRASQVGFFVRDSLGQIFYLKKSLSHPELQSANEVISSEIYRHFGFYAPKTYIVDYEGERYSASELMPKGKDSTLVADMQSTSQMRILRVVAAFLMDWDRLRVGPNNRVFEDGSVGLFDFGGTLGTRALGRPKPGKVFSESVGAFTVPEVGSTNLFGEFIGDHPMTVLFDSFDVTWLPDNHPWHDLNEEDIEIALDFFRRLDSKKLKEIVKLADYSQGTDYHQMLKSLLTRRDLFLDYLQEYLNSQGPSLRQLESYWAQFAPEHPLTYDIRDNRNPQIGRDVRDFVDSQSQPIGNIILFRGQEELTTQILSPIARTKVKQGKVLNNDEIEELVISTLKKQHRTLRKERVEQRSHDSVTGNSDSTRSVLWADRATAMDSLASFHSKSNGHGLFVSTTRSLGVASRWVENPRFPTRYRYVYILSVPKERVYPITDSLIFYHGSNKESEYVIAYDASPYIIGVYDTIDLKFINF